MIWAKWTVTHQNDHFSPEMHRNDQNSPKFWLESCGFSFQFGKRSKQKFWPKTTRNSQLGFIVTKLVVLHAQDWEVHGIFHPKEVCCLLTISKITYRPKQRAWKGYRKVELTWEGQSGALCGSPMPLCLRGHFWTAVRLTLLYEADFFAMNKWYKDEAHVTETRVL